MKVREEAAFAIERGARREKEGRKAFGNHQRQKRQEERMWNTQGHKTQSHKKKMRPRGWGMGVFFSPLSPDGLIVPHMYRFGLFSLFDFEWIRAA